MKCWFAAAVVALVPFLGSLTQCHGDEAEARPVTALKPGVGAGDTARLLAHPLTPVIHMAEQGYRRIREQVRDYTCVLIKRERVNGRLEGYQYLAAKVRHRRTRADKVVTPFSVYLKFLGPAPLKGREVLYVEGRDNGKLRARRGGPRFGYVKSTVDPLGKLAMRGNRYPITEFGFENLIRRLLEVAREDRLAGRCAVKVTENARIDGRLARCIEVRHDAESDRQRHRFHLARIFIDRELDVPAHFESYDWPADGDGDPPLFEQYTFRNVRLNVGLSDRDFAPSTYDLD